MKVWRNAERRPVGTDLSLMSQLACKRERDMSRNARVTHKNTAEGRHTTLDRKAARARKHYAPALDCASILAGLRVAR